VNHPVLERAFLSYAQYHQHPGNKATHLVGIPMIMLSTFGLLALVGKGHIVNLGFLLWFVASAYIVFLDRRRGLPFAVVALIFYTLSISINWPIHLVLFSVGWILQGIGHFHFEKKSPAFLTNMSHLVIGPFWIYCYLFRQLD
jgi:uncharacterized membrane protein YGL010W